MATLPSRDPERFGRVHLLRRKQIDPGEEWQRHLDSGEASPQTYGERAGEAESDVKKSLESAVGTGSALCHFKDAVKWRTAQRVAMDREYSAQQKELLRETSRANLWRGLALVLIAMLLLVGYANWQGSTRQIDSEELEMRSP